MGKLSEVQGVEKPVTEWLEKMGWTYRSQDDLKIHKRRTSNPIIDTVLLQRIQSINHVDAELAQRILNTLLQALKKDSPVLGNEQATSNSWKNSPKA